MLEGLTVGFSVQHTGTILWIICQLASYQCYFASPLAVTRSLTDNPSWPIKYYIFPCLLITSKDPKDLLLIPAIAISRLTSSKMGSSFQVVRNANVQHLWFLRHLEKVQYAGIIACEQCVPSKRTTGETSVADKRMLSSPCKAKLVNQSCDVLWDAKREQLRSNSLESIARSSSWPGWGIEQCEIYLCQDSRGADSYRGSR